MIRLSAFADEISANLDEQIAVLHSENISFIDLRSVEGINVLDLTDQQVNEIKQKLDDQGIGVAAIGWRFRLTSTREARSRWPTRLVRPTFVSFHSIHPVGIQRTQRRFGTR